MSLGLPSVNIVFKKKASEAVQQGAVGVVALVVKDASVTNATEVKEYRLHRTEEIPTVLSETNKGFVQQAMLGQPNEVRLVVIAGEAAYAEAMSYLETIAFNIVAFPGADATEVTAWVAWAKAMFDAKDRKIMAVLPNVAADHPAIVNFSTDAIEVGTAVYSATQFTARIAGLVAGLPLSVAPTFQVLPEVTNVPKLTKFEADQAVSAGKLILYHDGEKVKIARGVTSFVTTTPDRGEDWKKIKIVRALNKVYQDIKETIEDDYIGKVSNTYINKLLLVAHRTVQILTLRRSARICGRSSIRWKSQK
jgi:Phage tail sheath protein subtilisin-like domain